MTQCISMTHSNTHENIQTQHIQIQHSTLKIHLTFKWHKICSYFIQHFIMTFVVDLRYTSFMKNKIKEHIKSSERLLLRATWCWVVNSVSSTIYWREPHISSYAIPIFILSKQMILTLLIICKASKV